MGGASPNQMQSPLLRGLTSSSFDSGGTLNQSLKKSIGDFLSKSKLVGINSANTQASSALLPNMLDNRSSNSMRNL